MYTAFILGCAKRLMAADLDFLFCRLERERIDIHRHEQLRAKRTLENLAEVVVRGSRRLSQNEMYNKHFRSPFRPLQKAEDVQVRIVKGNQ